MDIGLSTVAHIIIGFCTNPSSAMSSLKNEQKSTIAFKTRGVISLRKTLSGLSISYFEAELDKALIASHRRAFPITCALQATGTGL